MSMKPHDANSKTPDWWLYLQNARAELERSGRAFRTGQEIDEYIEQLRGESDPVQAAYWEAEWIKHHREGQ